MKTAERIADRFIDRLKLDPDAIGDIQDWLRKLTKTVKIEDGHIIVPIKLDLSFGKEDPQD